MKETVKFSKQVGNKIWNLSFKYITTIYVHIEEEGLRGLSKICDKS